jgi:hypothetical protein
MRPPDPLAADRTARRIRRVERLRSPRAERTRNLRLGEQSPGSLPVAEVGQSPGSLPVAGVGQSPDSPLVVEPRQGIRIRGSPLRYPGNLHPKLGSHRKQDNLPESRFNIKGHKVKKERIVEIKINPLKCEGVPFATSLEHKFNASFDTSGSPSRMFLIS